MKVPVVRAAIPLGKQSRTGSISRGTSTASNKTGSRRTLTPVLSVTVLSVHI